MLIENRGIFGLLMPNDNELVASEIERLKLSIDSLGKKTLIWKSKDRDVVLGKVIPSNSNDSLYYDKNGVISLIVGDVYNKEVLLKEVEKENNYEKYEKLITEAYMLKGEKLLQLLNGAYALAIWNPQKRKLLLACDHKSDTHLYYHANDKRFWFSTWLKVFTNNKTPIDKVGVEEFLRFFYILPPRTIYQGVFRLEPGHYLIWEDGKVSVNSYLKIPQNKSKYIHKGYSKEKALETFEKILLSSIQKRFEKKRVGIFLSGGVDSAVITAACKRLIPEHTIAYTVGFNDPKLDESSLASAFTRHLKMPHKILHFNIDNYHDAFEEMSKGFDQPFGDPACLPVLLTCKASRDDVDVMTGGSGGDDLFGSHVERPVAVSFYINKVLPEKIRSKIGQIILKIPFQKISRYGTDFDFGDPEELYIMWNGWTRKELSKLMGYPVNFKEATFYKYFRKYKKYGAQVLHDELHSFPPEDSRLEGAGISGLAYYMPYHDPDVLDYVKTLPIEYRYTKQQAKILLHLLYRKYFPENLWGLKKHALNIPLQNILAYDRYALINRFLNKAEIINADLVPAENAVEWVSRFMKGDVSLTLKIWSLLVLHSWHSNR